MELGILAAPKGIKSLNVVHLITPKHHASKLFTSQTLISSSWCKEEMRKMFFQQLQLLSVDAALLTLLGAILYSALQF